MNRKKLLYQIGTLALLGLLIVILIRQSTELLDPARMIHDDFSHFWSTGKTNLSGGNPYDIEQVNQQRNLITGGLYNPEVSLDMRYPPWSMSIFSLMALIPYGASRFLWLFMHIAILIGSANALWKVFDGKPRQRIWGMLSAILFLPSVYLLWLGQMSGFEVLGAVGFLVMAQQKKWWAAGVFAGITLLKPHVVFLFLLAFGIHSLLERNWKMILGAVLTVSAMTALAMVFNPLLLKQFFQAIASYSGPDWVPPTLGTVLRLWLGWKLTWLNLIPPALGTIWLLIYWFQRKLNWDWKAELPLILAVSITTTYFGWIYDHVLLVIPLIWVSARFLRSLSSDALKTRLVKWVKPAVFIAALLAYEYLLFLPLLTGNDMWWMGTAPVFLVGMIVYHRFFDRPTEGQTQQPALVHPQGSG